MVKQWVQPPINKHRMVPGGFLLGSHLTSSILLYWNIRGKLRNPAFGNIIYFFLLLRIVLIKCEIVFLFSLIINVFIGVLEAPYYIIPLIIK